MFCISAASRLGPRLCNAHEANYMLMRKSGIYEKKQITCEAMDYE